MLKINRLEVKYNSYKALNGINLEIQKGKSCAVLGPSGCGKTTLLNAAAGFLPFSGSIICSTKPAFVMQDCGIFPWFTVRKNMQLAIPSYRKNKKYADKKIDSMLAKLELTEYADCYPGFLSGGQKQRAALGSVFLLEPELLLLDEPFSSLDAFTREELQDLILSMMLEKNTAALIATHSIEEALFLGSEIYIMKNGRLLSRFLNPLYGEKNARGEKEFYELCMELRRLLNRAFQDE